MVERWEEVGLDAEPGSRYGDRLAGLLIGILDVDGLLRIEHVPGEPNPGDLIVGSDAGLELEDLLKLARNFGAVRIAVPNDWGLSLKPVHELTEEDHAAIARYFEQERAHSERMVTMLGSTLDMLGGNSGKWKPGQTMGDWLEELDREIDKDLQDSGGVV